MPFVESSAITRIEYDAGARILSVWLLGRDRPYDYFGVPEAVYASFLEAASKGRFFNQFVRDRYPERYRGR